jgi:hypothetical protein
MIPAAYRDVLGHTQARRLLLGLGVSALGDGMSMVVLAARSAIVMVAGPLGTAAGGPVVGALGAAQTLAASGLATVVLAVITGVLWTRGRQPRSVDRRAPAGAARRAGRAVLTGRLRSAPATVAPLVKTSEMLTYDRP